ncbi:MAG: phage terminase large subunit [Methermicoccaceae archaeon]
MAKSELKTEAHELLKLLSPSHFWRAIEKPPYPYQHAFLEDTSQHIIIKAGRQTGKSTAAAIRALHTALLPNKSVLIVSPSLRQSTEIFRKIQAYATKAKLAPRRATQTELELENGSRIVSLPASEHTIRGYTANLLIVDEAAFVPDELFDAIIPSLAATNGSLILLSTPFGKDSFFYRAWLDPSFSHHEFSAKECPHYSQDFLKTERERMSDLAFRQEYMAEFVEDTQCVFPHSLVMSSIAEPTRDEGNMFCGVDLAKHVDWTVFCIVKEVRGTLYTEHVEAHQKEPYPLVAQKLKVLHEQYQFKKVVVDATGVGEAVLDTLRWDASLPLEPFVFTQHTKVNLIENLKVALEKGELKLIQHRNLLSELTAFSYEVGQSTIKYGTQKSHDDHVIALALAVWGARVPTAPPLHEFVFGGRV